MNSGDKITFKELKILCRAFNDRVPTEKDRLDAIKYKTDLICGVGVWNPITTEFHWWNITPSSEDKGYSFP